MAKLLKANLGHSDAEWLYHNQHLIPEVYRSNLLIFAGTLWQAGFPAPPFKLIPALKYYKSGAWLLSLVVSNEWGADCRILGIDSR